MAITGVDALNIDLDAVNSVARRYIMPGIADAVYNSTVTNMEMKKRQSLKPGYTFMTGPVRYAEGAGGPYTGTQPFDINQSNKVTSWQARWKTHFASGTVTLFDQDRTTSPDAIADLFTIEYQGMEETLSQFLNIGFNSDGSDAADYVGIPVATAITGSYLGISKTLNSWWRGNIDSTTTLATLDLDKVRALRSSATQGNRKPNVIITTKSIYNRLYALHLAQQQFVNTQTLKAGFTEMMVEDMAVLEDDTHVAAGRLNMLYMPSWHYCVNRNRNMYFTGWKAPHNPPTYSSSYILHMACVVCNNPRFNAAFTGLV